MKPLSGVWRAGIISGGCHTVEQVGPPQWAVFTGNRRRRVLSVISQPATQLVWRALSGDTWASEERKHGDWRLLQTWPGWLLRSSAIVCQVEYLDWCDDDARNRENNLLNNRLFWKLYLVFPLPTDDNSIRFRNRFSVMVALM